MSDPDAPKSRASASKTSNRKAGWDDDAPAPSKAPVAKETNGDDHDPRDEQTNPAIPHPARSDRPRARDNARIDDDAPASEKAEKGPSPIAFLFGGHAFRWKRGGLIFLAGALGAFLLMAHDAQWRWGVPVGFFFVCIAAIGALDFIGSFDDDVLWPIGAPPRKSGEPRDESTVVSVLLFLPRAIASAAKRTETVATTRPPSRVAEGTTRLVDAAAPAVGAFAVLLTTMTLMANASRVPAWVYTSPHHHGWSIAFGALWGLAITAGWIGVCVLGYYALARVGLVDDAERPLLKRHGFWLIVFCCLLYLPTLGAHSLVDPWETHYGEVSREVLARDDWITIWWAEEGYFLSKPILDFWMQAIAMATFGVHYKPDGMIAPTAIGGPLQHPEWIVRLPSLTLSVIALYLAYKAISKVHGRRAGLLSAAVLATMSDWLMLSHQSITDMPFVASLTAAMSLLVIGLTTSDEETVTARRIAVGKRVFTVSGFHLSIGVILVCALPQAFYLFSRNVELVTQGNFGFSPHADSYQSGSGLECHLPDTAPNAFERLMRVGKWACEPGLNAHAVYAHPLFQPWVQGLIWLGVLGLLLAFNRNERRVSRLCFLVAWVFAAVSTMGKGVAGFLLPVCVAGCYIVTARKWRDVLRLEFISGVLVLAVVAAPWFVAMWGRMGDEFINQLFVHHMWKRALDHVHDTNQGDDVSLRYYVWQLGYGMFPWTGLVPAGLLWWARKRWGDQGKKLGVEEGKKRDVAIFLVMWFIFAWALFTYMKTKFHHYVFPALPAAALLTGIFLDEAIGPRLKMPTLRGVVVGLCTVAGVALMIFGFSRFIAGPFLGYLHLPDFEHMQTPQIVKWVGETFPADPFGGSLLATAGLFTVIFASHLATMKDDEETRALALNTLYVVLGAVALIGISFAIHNGDANEPKPVAQAMRVLSVVLLVAFRVLRWFVAARRAREKKPTDPTANDYRGLEKDEPRVDPSAARAPIIGAVALAAAFLTALVTRDLASRPELDIRGQERLIQLYTYRYDRLWPKELWFQPALLGFGLAATAIILLLAVRAYRRQAIVAMVALSALFTAWTLDDYMVRVAPHWGQRPLFEAYYRDRKAINEPIVAFEMNWKGENFYSGGRLIEFGNGMSQGSTAGERASDRMRSWIADMRSKTNAIYFVTEANRIGKIDGYLRDALGPPPNGRATWSERITTDQDDNKFCVIRVRWAG